MPIKKRWVSRKTRGRVNQVNCHRVLDTNIVLSWWGPEPELYCGPSTWSTLTLH